MTDVDYGGAAFPTSGWCHVIAIVTTRPFLICRVPRMAE